MSDQLEPRANLMDILTCAAFLFFLVALVALGAWQGMSGVPL